VVADITHKDNNLKLAEIIHTTSSSTVSEDIFEEQASYKDFGLCIVRLWNNSEVCHINKNIKDGLERYVSV
jgi:hypothetical protein